MIIDAVANFLHILGVLIWIGGMFYTLFILRPSLNVIGKEKLVLIPELMGRFFKFVWIAIFLLLITGGYRAHLHVQSYIFDAKLLIYLVMVLIFSYIYFNLYKKLIKASNEEKPLLINKITALIKLNFSLGLIVILLIELYKKGV